MKSQEKAKQTRLEKRKRMQKAKRKEKRKVKKAKAWEALLIPMRGFEGCIL